MKARKLGTKYGLSLWVAFLLMIIPSLVWALGDTYNRPAPLMDYVPQEMGMIDTVYNDLNPYDILGKAPDCRACHGNSMADRHHATDIVTVYRRCTDCHGVIQAPPGVTLATDCTTPGCHNWDYNIGPKDDAGTGYNGWHHDTAASGADQCIRCHNPNLVGPLGDFRPIDSPDYAPSVEPLPTPFTCENCHWEEEDAYDHPVRDNNVTHHMGEKGNIQENCYLCHANDIGDPDWDTSNENLIRYCERCHDINTLHNISGHVNTVDAWEAVGFHAPGGGSTPEYYRAFTSDELCWGCHASLPGQAPVSSCSPYIEDMSPRSACLLAPVTITGTCFGDLGPESQVQIMVGSSWIAVSDFSWWENDRIVFTLPCDAGLSTGNTRIRVQNVDGAVTLSNELGFTIKECCSPCGGNVLPPAGPCRTKISLSSGAAAFGAAQDTNDGTYRAIQVTNTQGDYLALNVKRWENNQINFVFKDFFQDLNSNFIQNLPGEPTISLCQGMDLGTFNVSIRTISYSDVDTSGTYTNGDTVYAVESSLPFVFEQTDGPFIKRVLNGLTIRKGDVIRLAGERFGDTQGTATVHMGKKWAGKDPSLGLGNTKKVRKWSDTRIKFRAKFPDNWIGKTRFVWIEKDGMKSNAVPVQIVP